jgi:hypothetical protein
MPRTAGELATCRHLVALDLFPGETRLGHFPHFLWAYYTLGRLYAVLRQRQITTTQTKTLGALRWSARGDFSFEPKVDDSLIAAFFAMRWDLKEPSHYKICSSCDNKLQWN